jgi:hypothetical protein
MVTSHSCSQILQRAKLQLFNRAFTAPKFFGNLTHAFLLDKPALNHETLIWRQFFHQLRKHGGLFDLGIGGPRAKGGGIQQNPIRIFSIVRGVVAVVEHCVPPGEATVTIRQEIRCNSHQPRGKWKAAPFVSWQVAQCFVKDFGRQVFGVVALRYAAGDIAIHTREVAFVELGKSRRILLRRRDQHLLVNCVFKNLQATLRQQTLYLTNRGMRGKGYGEWEKAGIETGARSNGRWTRKAKLAGLRRKQSRYLKSVAAKCQ